MNPLLFSANLNLEILKVAEIFRQLFLLILKAMEMQNEIPADTDGVVKKFNIAAEQSVKTMNPLLFLADSNSEILKVAEIFRRLFLLHKF